MKKPKLVKSGLDKEIAELVAAADKKTLVIWACDCADRVLSHVESAYPEDNRPRQAIEAARTWVKTGVFKMADVRRVALAAHAAARDADDDDAARSAARAAGQALATTHVPTHAIAAAIYAATSIRDSVEASDADAAVMKEREWQYHHLRCLQNERRETE